MIIKFKNIRLYNFMSFGDSTVDLTKSGYTLVQGVNKNPDDLAKSNGAGKSTIFDGIVWALTGTTIRGSKDVVNINGDDGALVELEFLIDDKEYKIIRTKDHSKYKTNLKLFINGEDKSGKGIRDTSALLTEYLPDLTYELIGSVIIMGQGLPQKFTNNTPSGRKELLEKLSKSDFMIDDLKGRIGKRKIALSVDARSCEDELLRLKTQKNQFEESKQKYTELLDKLPSKEDIELKISEYELTLNELNKTFDIDKLNSEVSMVEEEQNKLTKLLTDLLTEESNKLNELQLNYNESIAEPNSKIIEIGTQIKLLSEEIKKLDSVSDTCPTCGQKLPDVVKIDTSKQKQELLLLKAQKESFGDIVDKLSKKYIDDKTEIVNKYASKKGEFKQKTESLKEKKSDINSQVNVFKFKEDECKFNISKYKLELDSLTSKSDMYRTEIDSAEKQLNEISDKILYYNNKHDNIDLRISAISKMESAVKRDFRGVLLTNVINYINNKSKEYCMLVFGTDKLDFILDGNNISISYDKKEYENLSGGEKVRVDIIIQLALRDMLCKFLNFSSNILAIDEIFDALDNIGCENITNLIFKELKDVENIYIITHRADLPISCDNEITVEKDERGISNIC